MLSNLAKKYTFTILALLFVACSTCKISKRYSIQEIQFGGGGGITDNYSKYILRNAKIYDSAGHKIKKITYGEMLDLTMLAEQIEESNVNPGNVSKYITIVKEDKEIHLIWDWMQQPDSVVESLYNKLNNLL